MGTKLSEWYKYDNYARDIAFRYEGETDIGKALGCEVKDGEKICFSESSFGSLGTTIKSLYGFTMVNCSDMEKSYYIKYVWEGETSSDPDPDVACGIYTEPSLTTVFNSIGTPIHFMKYYLLVSSAYIPERRIFYKQMEDVIQILDANPSITVAGIIFSSFTEVQMHALSILFWKEKEIYHSLVYDPVYFVREGKSYLKAMKHVEDAIKEFPKNTTKPINIQFHNLSEKFCIRSPVQSSWVHCVQYIMNAEYCSIYCLYFLLMYAKNNCPRDDNGLRKVVYDSYIVNPTELTRDAYIQTNKFRIVMMSFMLSVLTLFCKNIKNAKVYNPTTDTLDKTCLEMVMEKNKSIADWKIFNGLGLELIHPDIRSNYLVGGRYGKKTLQKYTVKDLQKLCILRKLPYSGKAKEELIDLLGKKHKGVYRSKK